MGTGDVRDLEDDEMDGDGIPGVGKLRRIVEGVGTIGDLGTTEGVGTVTLGMLRDRTDCGTFRDRLEEEMDGVGSFGIAGDGR